jgi:hypothetical protein
LRRFFATPIRAINEGVGVVRPPCAASPPTTKVALRDGGHWVVVAGQVTRDAAGNVVGKGDLRAQIK